MVANTNIPHLEANECFDEIYGAKVLFNNPSEALLAQLFLKDEDAIPLPALDALLSVIRNPSFNVEDVSFKNCADFCSFVTSARVEGITRRGWVSEAGIPEIILEGALDVLGSELRNAWDVGSSHYMGDMLIRGHGSLFDTIRALRSSLVSVALVHSSWLVRARPLLGYYHRFCASARRPFRRSLTNSFLGPWTRDVQIKFEEYSPPPQDILFDAFFARLPNLQALHLGTSRFALEPRGVRIAGILSSLPYLTGLENISLTISNLKDMDRLALQLSKTPPPNLRIIQFSGYFHDEIEPVNAPQCLSPLSSMASLRYVRIHSTTNTRFVNGVVWSRSTTNSGSFGLEGLSISAKKVSSGFKNTSSSGFKDKVVDALRATRRLSFSYRGGRATVKRFLSKCRSLLSLNLIVIGDRREPNFFDIAEVLPSSIEELSIFFPPLDDSAHTLLPDDASHYVGSNKSATASEVFSKLDILDACIHSALHPERSPHLRDVKIFFHPRLININKDAFYSPNHRLLYRRKGLEGHDPLAEIHDTRESSYELIKTPLLPLCQQICFERGIPFSAELQLMKDDLGTRPEVCWDARSV
ncbi:hypothetical protein SCHPADRAFT_994023 [Schizopora paradoxa]|uniref:Uncharacterized protein n=1 Tax=Schizopora paradoxa TaxID=27342 RepID=A0A0H2SL83_9AGAM|nr:hypothetical protein SCHPADRAFT_994023 [Schizopora paradoxa]